MEETPSAPTSSDPPAAHVTRRQLLAGAAATTLVWAVPGVVKLDVALPQAAVSPPPEPRGQAAVRGRTIDREVGAVAGRRVHTAAADPADTLTSAGTEAWKLAGTASVALAAGSLAVWGPEREPAQNPVPADGPSDARS